SFYNNVGRIEVPPIPTDPDATKSGIRYRFGFYPVFEPPSIEGWGLLRYRYINPKTEDNVFVYQSRARRMRRFTASTLSDMIGAVTGFVVASVGGGGADLASYASTVDPDSFFGFSAKIEDYDYKFIGEKQMLASVHAKNSPAIACKDD